MQTAADTPVRALVNKVPEITLSFWAIKVLATTVGETAADYLNFNLGIGLTDTSLVVAALFAVALAFQMRARKFHQPLYWRAWSARSSPTTSSIISACPCRS